MAKVCLTLRGLSIGLRVIYRWRFVEILIEIERLRKLAYAMLWRNSLEVLYEN